MSFKRYLNISLFANVSNVLRIKLINLSTAEAVLRLYRKTLYIDTFKINLSTAEAVLRLC